MKIKFSFRKKLSLAFLVVLVLLQAGSVLALELKYPKVPGALTPNEIQEKLQLGEKAGGIPKSQALSLYIKYWLHLIFFLAISITASVIVYGGVLYLLSGARPSLMLTARSWIKSGFWGLSIIVLSFLLLIVINPQFLTYQIKIPSPLPPPPTTSIAEENEVVVARVPLTEIAQRNLDAISEKVPKEKVIEDLKTENLLKIEQETENPQALKKRSGLLSFLKKFLPKTTKASNPEMVYKSQAPLLRLEKIVEEVIPIVQDLQKSLQSCRCGSSYYHIEQNNLNWECLPGMSDGDRANFLKNKEPTSRNLCLTQCDDCGTPKVDENNKMLCDLRKVRIKEIEDENGNIKTVVQIKTNPDLKDDNDKAWQAIDEVPNAKETSIRYKILLLKKLLAQIKGEEAKFAPEEITLLEKALKINAMNYWANEAKESRFASDFSLFEKDLKEKGYKVTTIIPKNLEKETPIPESQPSEVSWLEKLIAQVKAAVKGENFVPAVPYEGPNYFMVLQAPPLILDAKTQYENQKVYRDGTRINTFSVLTDLSLEEIEQIFNECLTNAFGEADYSIGREKIKEVVEQAINEGTKESLINSIKNNTNDYSDRVIKGMTNAIAEKEKKRKEEWCQQECKGKEDSDCQKKCLKSGAPPSFLSNELAKLLTEPLKNWLPQSLTNLIETEFHELLLCQPAQSETQCAEGQYFDPQKGCCNKFEEYLTKDMFNLINGVMEGALTRSFAEQFPEIKKLFEKSVFEIMPQFILEPVQDLDRLITEQVESLRDRLPSITEAYVQDLARQFVGEPVGKLIENFKNNHPALFPENSSVEDCYERLEDGYYFVPNFEPNPPKFCFDDNGIIKDIEKNPENLKNYIEPGALGKCQKMDPETIREPLLVYWRLNLDNVTEIKDGEKTCFQIEKKAFTPIPVNPNKIPAICQGAGYCWGSQTTLEISSQGVFERGETPPNCHQCQWFTDDIKNAVGSKENLKKAGRKFVAGLVNFGEQFFSALIETLTHTAFQWARVEVEDQLVTKVKPFLGQAETFKEGVQKVFRLKMKDVLPEQITKTLNSNVKTLLRDACRLYQTQNNPDIPDDKEELTLTTISAESANITWGGKPLDVNQEIKIPAAAAKLACSAQEELSKTGFQQLESLGGVWEKISTTLQSSIEKETGILEILEKTPAEILFKDILNINDLIKGSPKQILCGELTGVNLKTGKIGVYTGNENQKILKDFCQGITTTTDYALVPKINNLNTLAETPGNGITQENKDILVPACFFIFSACQNPLANIEISIGGTVAALGGALCSLNEIKAENSCQGVCWDIGGPDSAMLLDEQCQPPIKKICEACSITTKNSVAFSLIYYLVNQVYDLKLYGNAYPKNITQKLTNMKENENMAYQWLSLIFPDLKKEISKVAKRRNTGFDQINQNQIQVDYKKIENFVTQLKATLPSLKELLITLPLGVIKPAEERAETLLREEHNGQGPEESNFLAETPYQLLTTEICPKIEREYQEEYPDWTLEAVQQKSLSEIGKVLPYSIEEVKLSRLTISGYLRAIASNPNIEGEIKSAYLFCKALNLTPAEILDLNRTLKKYIQPKEFQILFDLMYDNLRPGQPEDCKPDEYFKKDGYKTECCVKLSTGEESCYPVGERPPALSQVLDYLENMTPVDVLREMAEKKYDPSLDTSAIELLAEFNKYSDQSPVLQDDVNLIKDKRGIPEKLIKELKVSPMTALTDSHILIKINDQPVLAILGYHYYITESPKFGSPSFAIYTNPNYESAILYGMADYLETPLNSYLKQREEMQTPMIDHLINYTCSQLSENNEFLENLKTALGEIEGIQLESLTEFLTKESWGLDDGIPLENQKKEQFQKTCQEFFNFNLEGLLNIYISSNISVDVREKISQVISLLLSQWLTKTPMELLGEIELPMIETELTSEDLSLMDKIAGPNTVLGKPYIDTLGEAFPWLDLGRAFATKEYLGEVVDKGITEGRNWLAGQVNTALTQWPKKIANKLTELVGIELGKKLGSQGFGSCRKVESEKECEEKEIFRTRTLSNGDALKECCTLGGNIVCEPKCREISPGQECNETEGERRVITDQKIMCCYQNANINQDCLKCRLQYADQGGQCSASEIKATSEPNGYNLCCTEREKRIKDNVEMCCSTITECVASKLGPHLKEIANMLSQGDIPVTSLTQ